MRRERREWLLFRAALGWVLLGCSTKAPLATSAADAGDPPPSAYAECDPTGEHDAATFTYTATCSTGASDAGPPAHCVQWSESADGDWTSFLESCLEDAGTITTTPCPASGLGGACALPAGCTTQTTVFYYGAAQTTSGQEACAANAGTFSP